jgi:hypothetical protein
VSVAQCLVLITNHSVGVVAQCLVPTINHSDGIVSAKCVCLFMIFLCWLSPYGGVLSHVVCDAIRSHFTSFGCKTIQFSIVIQKSFALKF